jgi:hypothetical protein
MRSLRFFLIILTASIVVGGTLLAQEEGPPYGRGSGRGRERLERFKKMRLIEVLNLKEDDAVRFTAKHTAHENAMHDLMKERMDLIDQLERQLQTKAGDKELQKSFDQLQQNNQKTFDERRRFEGDVKTMLTPEQMAKFYVFERNFERELREAMDDVRRERFRRQGKD